MTEENTHQGQAPVDPAQSGATIGGGLVPDEVLDGEAEVAAAKQTTKPSADGAAATDSAD